MITSKQRAMLRGMANSLDTIVQIGKTGITPAIVQQTDQALVARELVKLRALETAPEAAREAAQLLAEQLGAEIIQVIGTRFVLFRRNHKKPQITLD